MKKWILRLRGLGVWLCVLWELLVMLDIPVLSNLVYVMPFAQGALAILALIADPPKTRCRWILCAGFAWLCVVTTIRGLEQVSLARYALGNAAFAYFVCDAAGRADADARKLLRRIALTAAAVTAVYALFGIFAALSGRRIYTFDASHYAGFRKGRLYLFRYPTIAGNLLMIAVLATLWLLTETKRLSGQLLLGGAACLDLICLGLTDTRTAFVVLGAAIGIALAEHIRRMPRLRLPKVPAMGLAVLACVAGVYALLSLVPRLYSALGIPSSGKLYLNNWLPLAATAGAESAVKTVEATHRALDAGALLSGRPAVWRAALALFGEQPMALLTGIGTVHPMDTIRPLVTDSAIKYNHVHSIYLQTLVETGVPGLLLAAAYLFELARAMLCLLRHPRSTASDRALTLLPLGLLLMDLGECHLLLELQNPSLPLLFLFAGAVMGRAERITTEARG